MPENGSASKSHVFGLTPKSLRACLKAIDLPPFAAGQVLDWVYVDGEGDMDYILDNVLCCTLDDEERFTVRYN